jgi:nicotinamidase-related amidase
MAAPLPDLSHAALLSMDLQKAIVGRYTKGHDEFIERAASVLAWARKRGILVIHVKVGFRPGLPEVSTRNALFGAIKTSTQWQQMFQGETGEIHPAVAPLQHEPVVIKHRVSAFAGTDLEMILRANEIDTLILTGIATSGVVLSTLLHASDADYRLVVVSDCCADNEPELHTALLEHLIPRRAVMLTANDLIAETLG